MFFFASSSPSVFSVYVNISNPLNVISKIDVEQAGSQYGGIKKKDVKNSANFWRDQIKQEKTIQPNEKTRRKKKHPLK